MSRPTVYEVVRVFTDPRGDDYTTDYATTETLAAAKREARKLKGRWIITETRVVAQSEPEGGE